jgi:hypothetical protein
VVALDNVREEASDNDLTVSTRPHIDVMDDRRGLSLSGSNRRLPLGDARAQSPNRDKSTPMRSPPTCPVSGVVATPSALVPLLAEADRRDCADGSSNSHATDCRCQSRCQSTSQHQTELRRSSWIRPLT